MEATWRTLFQHVNLVELHFTVLVCSCNCSSVRAESSVDYNTFTKLDLDQALTDILRSQRP